MKRIKWLAASMAIVMLLLTACGGEYTYTGATDGSPQGSLPETIIATVPSSTGQEEQVYGTTVPATLPTIAPTQGQEQDDYEESNAQMVWIPKSGKKYHSNPNCSGMKGPSKVSISEAKSRGYTACKKCW